MMNPKKRIGEVESRPLEELMGIGQGRGIPCPGCHGPGEWCVAYTRPKSGFILRVRKCRRCGHRQVTREFPAGQAPDSEAK